MVHPMPPDPEDDRPLSPDDAARESPDDIGMDAAPVLQDESLFEDPSPSGRARRRTLDGQVVDDYDADGEPTAQELIAGTDPEALASSIRHRRRRIRKQIFNAGSQFVIGLLAALFSLALIILAATVQTRPYIIAAAVVAPPALIFLAFSWRKWLGNAPYVYRLLTSLGEDADNLLEARVQKHRANQAKKLEKLHEKMRQRRGGPEVPEDFQNRL